MCGGMGIRPLKYRGYEQPPARWCVFPPEIEGV